MPTKERQQHVSPRYAHELNKLLELAKEAAPEVDPKVWPQPVQVADQGAGMTQVFAAYADVDTAARQVLALIPPPVGMRVT